MKTNAAIAIFASLILAACDRAPKPAAQPAQPDTAAQPAAAGDLDSRVLALFENRCAECHGKDGEEDPKLHKATALAELRNDAEQVKAGDPDGSPLFQRILLAPDKKKRMPKSEGAPGDKDYRAPLDDAEKATLRQWIAGNAAAAPARAFLSDDDITQTILDDLRKVEPARRAATRYLSLANLANLTLPGGKPAKPPEDLALFRSAVDKLINSLSWQKTITRAAPVNPEGTILRLDLEAYGWDADRWTRLLSFYPYAILHGTKPEADAARLTACELPWVRADWFVFALAQPPLYHEFLDLPGLDGSDGADTALEHKIGVNVTANLTAGRALRSGFEKSGVSFGNRMIERHVQRNGFGYWRSYDFRLEKKNEPGGDIFKSPLGPPGIGLASQSTREFHHDGGENIFALPNGLQGYILVNEKGKLIPRGPKDVVRDQKREDGAIINGVSCFFCHADGMFAPPPDQVRTTAASILTGADKTSLLALFDEAGIQRAIAEDTARFKKAIAACGVATGPGTREPVRTLYEQFREPITAATLASEFGQPADTFLADMARSRAEDVRLLASKLKSGVPIPRGNFIANFNLITHSLKLGSLRSFTDPGFEEFGGAKAPLPPAKPANPLDAGEIGKVLRAPLKDGVEIRLCYIPATTDPAVKHLFPNGTFKMGSPEGEVGRGSDEKQVDVRITKGFWMAETELTQGQWSAVMGTNPSKFKGASLPVESVSYDEVIQYIAALNAKHALPAGWEWILPTEAQWEYACRAGAKGPFNIGGKDVSSLSSKDANFNGNFPHGGAAKGTYLEKTTPVKSYAPNTWGLYDMHGNVWEWCYDGYGETLPGGPNPKVESGTFRVVRGGRWSSNAEHCRAASRYGYSPGGRSGDLGFRPAVSISGTQE